MPIQHIVLFDGDEWENLLPVSATRSVADIRIGILTIKEKWEKYLKVPVSILSKDYLNPKYSFIPTVNCLFINSAVLPAHLLVEEIVNLENNSILQNEETVIAASVVNNVINSLNDLKSLFETIKSKKKTKQSLTK